MSREYQGKRSTFPASQPEQILQFDSDRWFRISGNKVHARGTFRVDSSKEPVELDIYNETGSDPGVTQKSVLKLDDNTLRISTNPLEIPERPTSVDTDATTTFGVTELIRVE